MRGRPYTEAKIYYDAHVGEGEYLKTPGGSAYYVARVRPHRTIRRRLNLVVLRWPVDEIPVGATVRPLH